jgi:hypothetical protein
VEVIDEVLIGKRFKWSTPGRILRNQYVVDSMTSLRDWILDVKLPGGFWRDSYEDCGLR